MTLIHKVVLVEPFPKERPRVVRGRAHMTKRYKDRKTVLRHMFGEFDVDNVPLSLRIIAYRAVPASDSKKKAKSKAGDWCVAGGDADNIAGAVMDALFDDDKMIVSLEIERRWSDRQDRQGYLDIYINSA